VSVARTLTRAVLWLIQISSKFLYRYRDRKQKITFW